MPAVHLTKLSISRLDVHAAALAVEAAQRAARPTTSLRSSILANYSKLCWGERHGQRQSWASQDGCSECRYIPRPPRPGQGRNGWQVRPSIPETSIDCGLGDRLGEYGRVWSWWWQARHSGVQQSWTRSCPVVSRFVEYPDGAPVWQYRAYAMAGSVFCGEQSTRAAWMKG